MPSTADMPVAFVTAIEPFLSQSASIVETQEGYDVIENALPNTNRCARLSAVMPPAAPRSYAESINTADTYRRS